MLIRARHAIEFSRDGTIVDESQMPGLLQDLDGLTDQLVISHGWNNDLN